MSLPPLANLVALSSPDPTELLSLQARIEASGAFTEARHPGPGWVVASAPLAGTEPDPPEIRRSGLAFAEGRSLVSRPGRAPEDVAALVTDRPSALAGLPGDFGFLHIDGDGAGTAVRSAGGKVPFYVAGGAGRWTVATTLAHLLLLHPGELVLDPLINAIWASGHDAAPDRRTFVAGVRRLGRGEYARLDGPRPVFGRWWRPGGGGPPRSSPEHATRLRTLLLTDLERELDPTGGNLLALSGGVDSSALAGLAAGTLGFPLDTLTLLPDDARAAARDLHYVDSVAGSVGGFRSQTRVTVGAERRVSLLEELDVPFHMPQAYLSLLPPTIRDTGAKVLLSGELADQTVGSAGTRHDWARLTSPTGLLRTRSTLPGGAGPAARIWAEERLRDAIRRPHVPWPRRLPNMIRAELREEYHDWFRARRASAAGDRHPRRYLAMELEHDGFLGMNWEVASSLGLRRCMPFGTRGALELAFECHPSELIGPGTKRLLRRALADDVPAVNLDRPDKGRAGGSRGYGPSRLTAEVPAALESVFSPGWPPDANLEYWASFGTRQVVVFAKAFERWRSRGASLRGIQAEAERESGRDIDHR